MLARIAIVIFLSVSAFTFTAVLVHSRAVDSIHMGVIMITRMLSITADRAGSAGSAV